MEIIHKYLSAPLSAQFEVVESCNHRCLHCYNLDSDISNRPTVIIPDNTVLACAQKLIDSGIFAVVITGGEPLVKKSLTKKVISLFRENNVKVSLNTNLTLIDEEFIAFLKKEKIGILTSCPSAIPTSFERLVGVNNYERFESNIKRALEAGLGLTVNMVVTKDNREEVRTTAQKMKELGVSSFAATPMSLNMEYPRLDLLLSTQEVRSVIDDLLWAEKELGLRVDVLEALPKCLFPETILSENHSFLKRKCQAGRTTMAVSCNGDVRPCTHNPKSYGNILKEDLHGIWARMSDWRSLQYVPDECKECLWIHRCNGGCRTNAKAFSGEWDARDTWSTGPLRTFPPKGHGKPIEFNENTIFKVNDELRFREEYDHIYVVYNIKGNDYVMVNDVFYDFIIDMGSLDTINYHDLYQRYNTSAEDKGFNDSVTYLINKGILKVV